MSVSVSALISFRWMLPAAGALAMVLSGCGKPPSAKIVVPKIVSAETGPLPAAGTANRLKSEQSAFLRKHAQDPVDWYPWGDEAFDRSKKENKPLLLSIGYASCPWSQKMQQDTFSDPEIARFMNRHFVCVLVDREERPDINNSYLHFLFWKNKSSGWPLHVWLSPEGDPLYAGVYFPRDSTGPVASWRLTIEHVAGSWEKDPAYVSGKAKLVAEEYLEFYRGSWRTPETKGDPDKTEIREFLRLKPADQVAHLMALPEGKLGVKLRDIPGPELAKLWGTLTPEQLETIMNRLRAVGAAFLFGKLSGPAKEAAYDGYVVRARQMAWEKLSGLYDPINGGFSQVPKFPQPHLLLWLMTYAVDEKDGKFGKHREAVEMVRFTLDNILKGAIQDHLAGGFHRYSTDNHWMVPQFEKMLYDQAYMSEALLCTGLLTPEKPEYHRAARRALDYALTELSHPQGGFYCAEGSSSPVAPGSAQMAEGIHYLWQKDEVDRIVGAQHAPFFASVFGLEERGNMPIDNAVISRLPKANLLSLKRTPEQAAADAALDPATAATVFREGCDKLLEARRKRPRPTLEDKALASWSGTMISALARCGWAFNDSAYVDRAVKAADFILSRMRRKDGGLVHAFLDGPSNAPGFSEDYSTVVRGLLDLYEATGTARWLSAAAELQEIQIKELWDPSGVGFYDGPLTRMLFHRIKSVDESSELAAGAVSVQNLVRLAAFFPLPEYRDRARIVVERFCTQVTMSPGGFIRLIQPAWQSLRPSEQVVVSGLPDAPDRAAVLAALRPRFRPAAVILYLDGGESEKLLLEKNEALRPLAARPGKTLVTFCRDFKPVKNLTDSTAVAQWATAEFALP